MVKPKEERRYHVTGNILYDHTLYKSGDEIVFGPHVSDETIDDLVNTGNLQGEASLRIARERLIQEASTGLQGMTEAEMVRIWTNYTRMNEEIRQYNEQQEARTKEDADGARNANIDDAMITAKALRKGSD